MASAFQNSINRASLVSETNEEKDIEKKNFETLL